MKNAKNNKQNCEIVNKIEKYTLSAQLWCSLSFTRRKLYISRMCWSVLLLGKLFFQRWNLILYRAFQEISTCYTLVKAPSFTTTTSIWQTFAVHKYCYTPFYLYKYIYIIFYIYIKLYIYIMCPELHNIFLRNNVLKTHLLASFFASLSSIIVIPLSALLWKLS